MALTERTRAYETLIRHNANGTIGAHHIQISEVLRNGAVISATTLAPVDITDGMGVVLGEHLALALSENARLTADAFQLREEINTLQNQIAALTESPE